MEWRVILRRGKSPYNHRVAVVQVADASGMILVIQIHPMSRKFSNIPSSILDKNLYRLPKEASGTFPFSCSAPVLIGLQELIENAEIPKLGVNITSTDIHSLLRILFKADYVQTTGRNYLTITVSWRKISSSLENL